MIFQETFYPTFQETLATTETFGQETKETSPFRGVSNLSFVSRSIGLSYFEGAFRVGILAVEQTAPPTISPRACRAPHADPQQRRTDVTETIEVPREWLSRAVRLLDAMAGEGIDMDGQTDPAILMVDLVDHFGAGAEGDPWEAMIAKLGATP